MSFVSVTVLSALVLALSNCTLLEDYTQLILHICEEGVSEQLKLYLHVITWWHTVEESYARYEMLITWNISKLFILQVTGLLRYFSKSNTFKKQT